jgi:hypothetical protein
MNQDNNKRSVVPLEMVTGMSDCAGEGEILSRLFSRFIIIDTGTHLAYSAASQITASHLLQMFSSCGFPAAPGSHPVKFFRNGLVKASHL